MAAMQQDGTARPGGEAAGGIAPKPDDPTDPKAVAKQSEADDAALAERNFGDHQGGRLRGPDEKGPEGR